MLPRGISLSCCISLVYALENVFWLLFSQQNFVCLWKILNLYIPCKGEGKGYKNCTIYALPPSQSLDVFKMWLGRVFQFPSILGYSVILIQFSEIFCMIPVRAPGRLLGQLFGNWKWVVILGYKKGTGLS